MSIFNQRLLEPSSSDHSERLRCAELVKYDFRSVDTSGTGKMGKIKLKGLLQTLLPQTSTADLDFFLSQTRFDAEGNLSYCDFIDSLFEVCEEDVPPGVNPD